jgi:hypothetical protein
LETRNPHTASRSRGPGRNRTRSRVFVITLIDTVAWLAVTAALAVAIGNSALLQIASAVVFTVLWFVAIRLWSPRV